jgi:CheY-like chemotaxis protein
MRDGQITSYRRLSDAAHKEVDDTGTGRPRPVNENNIRRPGVRARGRTPAVCAPVPILIVDNDIGSANSLELMLHAAGQLETRVAYSGHAALAIAADFHPVVVLLEVDLLDINGYALAQMLRAHAQTQNLRLIALTTSREHEGRELARVAGFERYLLKPVAAEDLADLLQMTSPGPS